MQARRPWDSERDRAGLALLVVGVLLVAGSVGWVRTRLERAEPLGVVLQDPASHLIIDVNSADVATLELLPQVGPVLARRIVLERERGGPFQSVTDLERVKGVGPKTSAEIGPFVRFGPVHPDQ